MKGFKSDGLFLLAYISGAIVSRVESIWLIAIFYIVIRVVFDSLLDKWFKERK